MTHEVQQLPTGVGRILSPGTLAEALEAIAGPRTRAIAGGTDLLIELERGQHDGLETLVDLSRVAGIDTIEEAGGRITIGSLVTHAKALADPTLQRHAVPLVQACREVGSPQLRNRATIVGNVVTASPANDTVSALLALDASVHLRSVRGERTMPLAQFQVGLRRTALEDDELVVGLSFPTPGPRSRGIFVKLGLRRAQAISVVHLAAVAEVAEPSGPVGVGPVVERLRLALGSVAPTVIRDRRVEQLVEGRILDEDLIAEAGALAASSVEPIDDLRATADYRQAMVEQLTVRALRALRDETGIVDTDPVLLWGDSRGDWPTGLDLSASHDATTPVTAEVNGSTISGLGATGRLLDWLREAGLTGTKEGCAEGECGSCTVHLDGLAVLSCLVPASRAEGAEIVTVEGLGQLVEPERPLHRLQEAFVQAGAVQCGYCIPGFLVAGAKLLEERPDPTEVDVVAGLAGNLCRCTGYYKIVEAMTAPVADAVRSAGHEGAADR